MTPTDGNGGPDARDTPAGSGPPPSATVDPPRGHRCGVLSRSHAPPPLDWSGYALVVRLSPAIGGDDSIYPITCPAAVVLDGTAVPLATGDWSINNVPGLGAATVSLPVPAEYVSVDRTRPTNPKVAIGGRRVLTAGAHIPDVDVPDGTTVWVTFLARDIAVTPEPPTLTEPA